MKQASQGAEGVVNTWQEIWNTIVKFFSDNVWNIVKFFSILVIGIIAIWIIMMVVRNILKARKVDKVAVRFMAGVLRFCLWLVLILILLASTGIEITGFTTAVSAALLAVGMALKDNLANLANGLILVGSKKYHAGDYIVVGNVEGNILEISYLFTALKTKDGKQVLMPNSTMVNSQVTNLGAFPKRRVDLTISVAYESDVELVKKIVTDVMKSDGKVYLDPEPFCRLKELNASSLDFLCYCWCDTEDYWDVYYYCIENIFNELKRNSISVPFQQVEVRQRTDQPPVIVVGDKLGKRVEKKRVQTKRKLTLSDLEDHAKLREFSQQAAEESKAKKKKKKAAEPKAEEPKEEDKK